jgi:hypothetical protein
MLFYSEKFSDIKAILNGVLWVDQPPFDPFTGIQKTNRFIYWANENTVNQFGQVDALDAISGSHNRTYGNYIYTLFPLYPYILLSILNPRAIHLDE